MALWLRWGVSDPIKWWELKRGTHSTSKSKGAGCFDGPRGSRPLLPHTPENTLCTWTALKRDPRNVSTPPLRAADHCLCRGEGGLAETEGKTPRWSVGVGRVDAISAWVWLGAAKPRLARTPGRFPQLSAPTTRSFCPMLHGPLPTRGAPAHVNTSLAAPEAFLLYQHNRENDPTSRSQHPVPGVHLRHSLRMITPRGPRAAWSGAFRPLEAASVGYRAPHYMDNGMFEQEAPPQQATATLSRSTFRRSIGLITPPGPRAA